MALGSEKATVEKSSQAPARGDAALRDDLHPENLQVRGNWTASGAREHDRHHAANADYPEYTCLAVGRQGAVDGFEPVFRAMMRVRGPPVHGATNAEPERARSGRITAQGRAKGKP